MFTHARVELAQDSSSHQVSQDLQDPVAVECTQSITLRLRGGADDADDLTTEIADKPASDPEAVIKSEEERSNEKDGDQNRDIDKEDVGDVQTDAIADGEKGNDMVPEMDSSGDGVGWARTEPTDEFEFSQFPDPRNPPRTGMENVPHNNLNGNFQDPYGGVDPSMYAAYWMGANGGMGVGYDAMGYEAQMAAVAAATYGYGMYDPSMYYGYGYGGYNGGFPQAFPNGVVGSFDNSIGNNFNNRGTPGGYMGTRGRGRGNTSWRGDFRGRGGRVGGRGRGRGGNVWIAPGLQGGEDVKKEEEVKQAEEVKEGDKMEGSPAKSATGKEEEGVKIEKEDEEEPPSAPRAMRILQRTELHMSPRKRSISPVAGGVPRRIRSPVPSLSHRRRDIGRSRSRSRHRTPTSPAAGRSRRLQRSPSPIDGGIPRHPRRVGRASPQPRSSSRRRRRSNESESRRPRNRPRSRSRSRRRSRSPPERRTSPASSSRRRRSTSRSVRTGSFRYRSREPEEPRSRSKSPKTASRRSDTNLVGDNSSEKERRRSNSPTSNPPPQPPPSSSSLPSLSTHNDSTKLDHQPPSVSTNNDLDEDEDDVLRIILPPSMVPDFEKNRSEESERRGSSHREKRRYSHRHRHRDERSDRRDGERKDSDRKEKDASDRRERETSDRRGKDSSDRREKDSSESRRERESNESSRREKESKDRRRGGRSISESCRRSRSRSRSREKDRKSRRRR